MTLRSAKLASFGKEALRSQTLPELNGVFRSCLRAFGFTAHAVGFIPGQDGCDEPFLLLDWPRVWLELYAREGFANEDAVVAAAATATEPFTWGELQRRQPGAGARIFAAARGFGWTDGLLVPVRIADGPHRDRLGVASLAAPTLADFDQDRRREAIEASTLAFRRGAALAGDRSPAALSERERQAIALVASGRSDREIGAVLSVSAATAHFHVEQAKRKLGAVTRAQAAAKAALQGLIAED